MRRAAGDDGQVTAMWTVLAVALLVLGGLVFDGGQVLAARRDANNLARQAARAGAQMVDETSVRAGEPILDPVAAQVAAEQYLAARGAVGRVEVAGDRVVVTVDLTQPTPLLSLVGIDEREVTGTGSARLVRGV